MDKLKSMTDIENERKAKKSTPIQTQEITVMKPSTKETLKTIAITILVTAIIAFIGGNIYANDLNSKRDNAVKSATATVLKDQTPQQ